MRSDILASRGFAPLSLLRRLPLRQDLALVLLLVVTLSLMVLPMPTMAADILIAVNMGLSVLLLMVAVYIPSPAEFSTLPTVILLTTVFRLAISITTARLVLTQADAGEIISTFGQFVISGNVVVGLVVFLIISVVQFLVITKGAERVAEVAARFALDAMPGKQMSIDTDARNGVIKPEEARRRRSLLERESQLYGAMDGAMKFVKGDAIASLIIIAVNLLGGITIGCLQMGMSVGQAGTTYSLLAVGDGLIAQIPALLISLSAGLVVTRVGATGGSSLGTDIVAQVTTDPRVLQVAAVVLAALGLVPGFPIGVFFVLAALLGISGFVLGRTRRRQQVDDDAALQDAIEELRGGAALVVRIGPRLQPGRASIAKVLQAQRARLSDELGIALPRFEIVETPETPSDLVFEFDRLPVLSARLAAGEVWHEAGTGTAEGTARIGPGGRPWVVREQLALPAPADPLGVDAATVAGLYAQQTLMRLTGQFIGIQETQILINRAEGAYGDLVREAVRAAPLPRLAEVFRRLVEEQVSLRNMRQVLEAVAAWAPREADPAMLAEYVRIGLRQQICHRHALPDGTLPILLVEDDLAASLLAGRRDTLSGPVLEPQDGEALLEAVRGQLARRAGSVGPDANRLAIVTSVELRRHLRAFLSRSGLDVAVLSHPEIAPGFAIDVVGTLGLPAVAGARRPAPTLETV